EVEATSVHGLSLHSSRETLLQFKPTQEVLLKNNTRNPFATTLLDYKETITSDELDNLGYSKGQLNLVTGGNKEVKISIIHIDDSLPAVREEFERVVFEGQVSDFKTIAYDLPTDRHK